MDLLQVRGRRWLARRWRLRGSSFFVSFFFCRRQASNASDQSLRRGLHGGLVGPLVVEEFLERIYSVQADIDDLGAGAQLAFTQTPDQVFRAVCYMRDAMQSDLRRRTFDGVHGPQQ